MYMASYDESHAFDSIQYALDDSNAVVYDDVDDVDDVIEMILILILAFDAAIKMNVERVL